MHHYCYPKKPEHCSVCGDLWTVIIVKCDKCGIEVATYPMHCPDNKCDELNFVPDPNVSGDYCDICYMMFHGDQAVKMEKTERVKDDSIPIKAS